MNNPPLKRTPKINFYLLAFVAFTLYLLIVIENVSQRTGIGSAYSQWLFFPTLIMGGIAAITAIKSFRYARWLKGPMIISILILMSQAILVGIRITPGTSPSVFTAYLSGTLLVHAMALTTAVLAFRYQNYEVGHLQFKTNFAKLSLWTAGLTFISMVSGVFVTITGSAQACASWPLCNGFLMPTNVYEWVQIIHRLSVGLSSVFVLILVSQAWKSERNSAVELVLATASSILFFAQGLIGAVLIGKSSTLDLISLHTATATASWAIMIVLVVQVGLSPTINKTEKVNSPVGSWRERTKDFLVLTKPIIVLLLLVTTVTGMIVGAQGWPGFSVFIWTLIGGAMAAGGASAINQYIDRDLDKLMKRTSRRPLAAKRLTPAEGLAFGVGLCLASFYLLAIFTNLLAAFLAVVGMFYYVWLYSLVLKKTTVQNIVIGGGAGAVPPLVGWAAATGEITWAALFLFVIIFFWTPPHFWALALVRVKDYARGGVPMLPVIKGEKETRKQILIYTIALVLITMAAPVVGIGGWIYVVSAIVLGIVLFWAAWRLWQENSTQRAWKMYRYSSMYLAFLFLAMVLDALI